MKLENFSMSGKFIIVVLMFMAILLSYCSPVFANNVVEAKDFFDNYIKLCHSYNKAVIDQYADNAIIRRILIYPDNTSKSKILPIGDYKNKLKFYAPLARLRGYKNIYHNLKFEPEGANVRIEGLRQVAYENYKTPISILVGKNKSGRWVILEEILHTKAIKLL